MTAPETTPTFIARLALADALDHLEKMQERGTDPVDIVAEMVERHGATVNFSAGTNVLRCCGVTGSCTRDRAAGMLASWQRIAERRFGRINTPGARHPLMSNPSMAQVHG